MKKVGICWFFLWIVWILVGYCVLYNFDYLLWEGNVDIFFVQCVVGFFVEYEYYVLVVGVFYLDLQGQGNCVFVEIGNYCYWCWVFQNLWVIGYGQENVLCIFQVGVVVDVDVEDYFVQWFGGVVGYCFVGQCFVGYDDLFVVVVMQYGVEDQD